MSQPEEPFWLAWVIPILAVIGVVWSILTRAFKHAIREQMNDMHQENQAHLREMELNLSEIAERLSNIEGRMQERWGDSRPD